MTYNSVLPEVFPFAVVLPMEKAMEYITILINQESIAPHGSSFALTTDGTVPGHRRLWLSEVSMRRLDQLDRRPLLRPTPTRPAGGNVVS